MFEWKENYSCDVKQIDDEHKRLFEIGRNIYELAMDENHIDYYDKILDLLDELKDYTVYHFGDEERIMELYDYPGLEEQKHIHAKFIDKLENIDLKSIDINQQKAILDLLDFVSSWISSHILGTDLKIGEYFKKLKLNK
ncbi:bacteriohemerythrin [Clostridium fermenticellae]|uniref:Bacteriohemerythrin n=1 Tax=Clostridium fermenticellae TaxID=2068654 RepID=A0A386H3D0_9CLOT|nr:hemerythrin family protein [Clostridium fermenticellae]AYD40164.1 bacteriohemerythrin [Clostridium fermenticellae]